MSDEIVSPLFKLSSYQWMDIVQYLSAEEFKDLRLAGNKSLSVTDPTLTSHLQLRMDEAPFFCDNTYVSELETKQWLLNRSKLIIRGATDVAISPSRLAYLVMNGFLDSVNQIIIFDCHHHRTLISILATLPKIESLMLIDQGEGEALDELEWIVKRVGQMHSLKKLDIEFNCVIHGSRLTFLRPLQQLRYLRLRGFDLSEGLHNIGGLRELESLHLCHGNFFSSPDDDINEEDLQYFHGLTKVQSLHLEGFDCLTGKGFEPFRLSGSLKHLVLKHCQELSEDSLQYIGKLRSLESLHIVLSAYDDAPVFERDNLEHLNSLSDLKRLSFFYALPGPEELLTLRGLTSLQTLNVAFDDDVDEEEVEEMCQSILPTFGSLRKLRMFSEEGMSYSLQHGSLEIEFDRFNFGDLVYLD